MHGGRGCGGEGSALERKTRERRARGRGRGRGYDMMVAGSREVRAIVRIELAWRRRAHREEQQVGMRGRGEHCKDAYSSA